ncbi:hypothetical protein VQ042_20825 [Aurantimonas sp. A2-1-M11]|uniref:hypothetical protein n=1 Tax=Aurantimonas sp. A2-1-M11 TaxID=3113712 RepID=UPI002F931732
MEEAKQSQYDDRDMDWLHRPSMDAIIGTSASIFHNLEGRYSIDGGSPMIAMASWNGGVGMVDRSKVTISMAQDAGSM